MNGLIILLVILMPIGLWLGIRAWKLEERIYVMQVDMKIQNDRAVLMIQRERELLAECDRMGRQVDSLKIDMGRHAENWHPNVPLAAVFERTKL